MILIKRIVLVTAIIAAIVGAMIWSEKHDKAVMESADRYEKCVKAQYGVSPANWYAEHGEYPKCETLETLTK